MPNSNADNHFDMLIVGAGLSGIGTAYWLQKKCPHKKYTILEARDTVGGTWSLFKYPGIRSDSDMFTFGYRFKPWQDPQAISDGPSILNYLKETVSENKIDEHIRFNHRVIEANWNSSNKQWEIQAETPDGPKLFHANFLYMCSGYYSYEQAHRPEFPGESNFEGKIVHPQFWPESMDYRGKQVVIVGSGATAVTLVPAMAKNASKVTMLQRSPSYVLSLPNENKFYKKLKAIFPTKWAFKVTRWKNILLNIALFEISRVFPNKMKNFFVSTVEKQLPQDFDVEKHFTPSYKPWDQRLCIVPDGDLFQAIREEKAFIETDEIDHLKSNGIQLKSGKLIASDLIVLATGLKVKLLGGARITVDQDEVHTSDVMIYRGMMVSNVPNMALAFGYTNASWTLKTDLTANYICRLLNYMDRRGFQTVCPEKSMESSTEPFLHLDSGYIKRASHLLPQQGRKSPWRVYQNYILDMLTIRFGRIADGVLKFR